MARQWWAELFGSRRPTTISLPELLGKLCCCDEVNSLYRQVLWQTSRHVEACIRDALAHGPSGPEGLQAIATSILDVLGDANQLDHELHRYIDSFVEETRDVDTIAMACDKGNVSGSHLSLATALVPSNIAAVVCPQVCHGGLTEDSPWPTDGFY